MARHNVKATLWLLTARNSFSPREPVGEYWLQLQQSIFNQTLLEGEVLKEHMQNVFQG